MMQRKVTKGREALCGKLEDIQKGQVGLAACPICRPAPVRRLARGWSWRLTRGWQVIVVFDGKRGEAAKETETDGGMRVGAALVAQRTPSLPHPTRPSPGQVVVTKGGDEETGAARVTADEWILQDMRCQQVHAFCHVCYACTCALHVCVCVPRAWVPAMRRQYATCPEACMLAHPGKRPCRSASRW